MEAPNKNGNKKTTILRLKCCKEQKNYKNKKKNTLNYIFFLQKICIYKKKYIPLPPIFKNKCLTIKKNKIMRTIYLIMRNQKVVCAYTNILDAVELKDQLNAEFGNIYKLVTTKLY